MGASKCVPVCSPQEKLFQYQADPRSSYREISSIRNGRHCPNSGGSTICGNSGDSVCVRSTTRIPPDKRSAASVVSEFAAIGLLACNGEQSRTDLALKNLRIFLPSGQPLLGHIARVDVLDAILERVDDGV